MTKQVYPGTLKQALIDPEVKSGDRLLLHAGIYTDDFTCDLIGVTIMPYPGEHVIIDGSLVAGGRNAILKDMEVMYSGWSSRKTSLPGSAPDDVPTSKTISMVGIGNKFINCVIHDMSGPGSLGDGNGTEIYGCVIYFNGWSAPDRGHGHGLYIQNNTPTKTIKDCIIFDNFGYGIHAYTEGGKINNITLEGNICFKAGSLYPAAYEPILVGGYVTADNPSLIANMTYGAAVNLGYVADGGFTNAVLTGNYFPDGITKLGDTQTVASETGNYYGPALGNQVFLRANDYNANRANLAIYNQTEANTVAVDTTGVFANGDVLNVRNVQDYFVDIQELTVAGNSITVNMQAINRSVATPVGWSAPATTFPQFGCFVLEKQ